MATCNEMIEGNVVAYACTLDAGHEGPHMALENERSVRERRRWQTEQANQRHAESGLGQFQGRAETTAERYTENPTEVPHRRRPSVDPDDIPLGAPPSEEVPIVRLPRAENLQPCPHVSCGADYVHRHEQGGVLYAPHTPSKPLDQVHTAQEIADELAHAAQEIADEIAHAGRKGEPIHRAPFDGNWLPEGMISEPTKQREGDQPLPEPTGGAYVQDRIIAKAQGLAERGDLTPEDFERIRATMEESKRVGTERYGTPLQIFNGRDALQDLVDELRDAFVYGSQLLQAREADYEVLVPVAQEAILKVWQDRIAEGVRATPEEHCLHFAAAAVTAILNATGPTSPPGRS